MSFLQLPLPPQSSSKQKDGEPQGSCFILIGDHQCGILLGDVRQLAACIPTIHAVRGCTYRKEENCTQCGY